MRTRNGYAGWRPGIVAAIALLAAACAVPAGAAAKRPSPQAVAKASLLHLAGVVRSSGLPKAEARGIAKDLRKASRSLSGRRACAALGAVADAHGAALELTGRKRRSLISAVRPAERSLSRLPAIRRCGPAVHHTTIKSIHPHFNPAKPPGPTLHEQGEEEDYQVPRDPHSHPVGPQGVATDVGSGGSAALASTVTDPLQIFANTDIGPLGRGIYPQEPQVAKAGEIVLYSGNTNGAVSFDGGEHFVRVDPNRVFGNEVSPICCDTVVRYAPSIDRFLWLMQYWCPQPKPNCSGDDKNNRYRLAVISPAALLAHRTDAAAGWQIFDLTTKRYESDTWFDYPDMAVGDRYLYLTWDLVGVGTANSRIALDQLAGHRTTVDVDWFKGTNIFYRLAQSPGNIGYFLKNNTDSRDAAYIWSDFLSLPIEVSLPHATRPNFSYSSVTPGGIQNWNDRAGSPVVKGATVRGDEIWVAWAAGRWFNEHGAGLTWPQPHIQYATYSVPDLYDVFFRGSLRHLRDDYIWSSTTAYTNPVLATNSEGDVGITLVGGDVHTMPTPYMGVLTNRAEIVRAILSVGPATAVVGDYAGLQPDAADPTRWVAANVYTKMEYFGVYGESWLFTRFGRAPTPPPAAPKDTRGPTQIQVTSTAGTAYGCCFVTDTIKVNGKLSGAVAGESVRLEFVPPSGKGSPSFQTVTIDDSGNFSGQFTPGESQSGAWTIYARYLGSTSFAPSSSEPYYQYVNSIPI